jgi:hypothetical protein
MLNGIRVHAKLEISIFQNHSSKTYDVLSDEKIDKISKDYVIQGTDEYACA